jgi:hypothetical protein
MYEIVAKIRRRLDRHRNSELRLNAVEAAIICLADSPKYVHDGDLGLNGQRLRKEVFARLAQAIPFETVVETGTWTGDSTGYLAMSTGLPVYSCELHRIPHTIAKMRLSDLPQVRLELADSRAFLRSLANTKVAQRRCLFYLDAHWHSDLPLAEELSIISRAWREYVIVVDDFRVPGDDGYCFDSYGPRKTLSIQVFGPEFSKNGLVAFFPTAPSSEETGYRRGYVVLAPRGALADTVSEIEGLGNRQPP